MDSPQDARHASDEQRDFETADVRSRVALRQDPIEPSPDVLRLRPPRPHRLGDEAIVEIIWQCELTLATHASAGLEG
jgi:hypothetical protein